MRKQKAGQFFYIVNAEYQYRNDELQPMLLEILKSIRGKKKYYYECKTHYGYRTHSRLNLAKLRNFNPLHINKIDEGFFIASTKFSAYLSNGFLEKIDKSDAAKMMLTQSDETYDSLSYNRLKRIV